MKKYGFKHLLTDNKIIQYNRNRPCTRTLNIFNLRFFIEKKC